MSSTESPRSLSTPAAALDRLYDWCLVLTRPIAFVGVLGMLIASGVTVIDVLLRWLANTGVAALNEIVSMTFAVAVTACIPAGLAAEVGITIDIVEKILARRTASWLRFVGTCLLLIFFALLTWRMAVYAQSLGGRTTVILALPQAPFIYATSALLAISTLVQSVVVLRLLRTAIASRDDTEARGMADTVVWFILGAIAVFAILVAVFFNSVSVWAQDHPTTVVIIGLLLMWVLLLGLIPMAAAIGMIGLVGTGLLLGFGPAFSAFATEASGFLTNYQVATLPLFLMMGSFAAVAGVAEDVYRLAQAVLGRFRGGLAMATIGGCAGFGAVTGSSLATVATFGRVSLPEMQARNYAPQFAAGCVAAGGTLGALIPPSGPLIIFALLSEASIGQLFVAAIVPGILAAVLFLITIAVVVRIAPDMAPSPKKSDTTELLAAVTRCGAAIALFGAVIGGMYSGVFTATEAAAVGAFGAFVVALIRGKLRPAQFWRVMADTTASTALIYTIIFGVLVFSFLVAASALPERATAFVSSLSLPPMVIIAMILAVYLALGCIMDSFTVMIVTVPIVTPVILHMGYDIVWWGIINLMVVEAGLITPPFGLHIFLLKSILPKVPLERLYQGVLPFCVADFLSLLLLLAFPILALWLPSGMAR
jgi:tripartite ATP-independent transporter DctM subunit